MPRVGLAAQLHKSTPTALYLKWKWDEKRKEIRDTPPTMNQRRSPWNTQERDTEAKYTGLGLGSVSQYLSPGLDFPRSL